MKLAIKGHSSRGKEVIKLLEMLGGQNINYDGNCSNAYYYINNGVIKVDNIVENSCLYTLEGFEILYPYKVGEKVLYLNGSNKWCEGIIAKMYWDENIEILYYDVNNIDGTSAGKAKTMFLKPMKQKELKDYLKPGYVVEYDDGSRCIITQDIHGNNFGLQIGEANEWDSFILLDYIVKVYQIDRPGALHKNTHLTLVWEKPKEVELTMQQIADKFGIDINQLKIKK